MIGRDYTIRYGAKLYPVVREQIQPRLRGQTVRIEERLDGRVVARTPEGELSVKPCEIAERIAAPVPVIRNKPAPPPPTAGRRRWLYGFRLQDRPRLEETRAANDPNSKEEYEAGDGP